MGYVFDFEHDHDTAPRHLRDLLGGKGANLAELSSVVGAPVPPGFTISTGACRAVLEHDRWPEGLAEEIAAGIARLERRVGHRFGDPADPLLVSVRSGAPVSMPGMLDTVLDLGLGPAAVEGLAKTHGDDRFALDARRRFLSQFAEVVLGIDGASVEADLAEARRRAGVTLDAALDASQLAQLVAELEARIRATGASVPADPMGQLHAAIDAVFRSWWSPRAVAYRAHEQIPDDLGTAVNVQAMVFGNRDDRSGTGVAFSRDPATGERRPFGDFLANAQGDDVVAGKRSPIPLEEMASTFPEAHRALVGYLERLESHFGDVVDVEFTIEQDRLWLLQVRSAKRSGGAAVRIALDMTRPDDLGLPEADALCLVGPEHLEHLLGAQRLGGDPGPGGELGVGLPASPGTGVGHAYFDTDRALDARAEGIPIVLVRPETSPVDVPAMGVAEAIVTARGGLASHAAVVARGWGVPAVVGVTSFEVDELGLRTTDGDTVGEGELLTVDGDSGRVLRGGLTAAVVDVPPELDEVLGWAREVLERAGVAVPDDPVRCLALARRVLGPTGPDDEGTGR